MKAKGFLVKFTILLPVRSAWEERIPRPVSDEAIAAAVKRRKVLAGKRPRAASTTDYGGTISAGHDVVGSYFIVPDSET